MKVAEKDCWKRKWEGLIGIGVSDYVGVFRKNIYRGKLKKGLTCQENAKSDPLQSPPGICKNNGFICFITSIKTTKNLHIQQLKWHIYKIE